RAAHGWGAPAGATAMTDSRTGAVLRHLRKLAAGPDADSLADEELVRRVAANRDETAFESLVRRHGPLVWRVCLHVLGHVHAAETAFQATFFVLARRAGAIRKYQAVGSWLHGVAYRVALQARAASPSAGAHGREHGTMPRADPADEVTWRELQEALHEELS